LSSVFHFAGRDEWFHVDRRCHLPHADSNVAKLAPGIAVASGAPSSARIGADPACRWSHVLSVSETGGFLRSSTRADASHAQRQHPAAFGTTRLAPFQDALGHGVPGQFVRRGQDVTISGTSEIGTTVTATVA
jgi:hypothetical protein